MPQARKLARGSARSPESGTSAASASLPILDGLWQRCDHRAFRRALPAWTGPANGRRYARRLGPRCSSGRSRRWRASGPALGKKLAKLGLRTIGDLLFYAPHRYEAAVPERSIADLMAGEEATIAGEVRRVSVRRPRRNLAIVQARVADASDEITAVWFNQAWLADKLQPGTRVRLRGAPQARRLPGALVRPERRLGDRRLRAGLSGQRGDHAQAAARARRARPPACARRPRSAARRPEGARAAAPARRRARGAAPAALPRRGRGGAKAARVRRAARAAGRARACPGRARGGELAPALGAPGELVERYRGLLPFELTPDQETRDRRDRPRPRARGADAAAAPGRRRRRQDRGRALRAAARRRGGPARRADGADRDARRAALPHDRAALRASSACRSRS